MLSLGVQLQAGKQTPPPHPRVPCLLGLIVLPCETTSPDDSKGKKRRAPLPPTDKPPYSSKTQMNTDQLDKENFGKKSAITHRTSSFDLKLSSIMHHLQKPIAAPHKLGPCGKSSLPDSENPLFSVTESLKPNQYQLLGRNL
uniref:Uncharacterized protein n=1 Tax=Crocodylus porosus TaxID=8502 RepID=A0A7M4EE04_CROPO